jgi:hypothetical protein
MKTGYALPATLHGTSEAKQPPAPLLRSALSMRAFKQIDDQENRLTHLPSI